ncbi:hypothetical protein QBC44DRAFT_389777 [Cladorrhinum sp. PSN332]|nr:hypothetical protein QBC44DRAFT_389777 [Cladorrhinum sp. PSN332]
MGHLGYIQTPLGLVFCKDCENAEQQTMFPDEPAAFCSQHYSSEAALGVLESSIEDGSQLGETPMLKFPGPEADSFAGQQDTSSNTRQFSSLPLPDETAVQETFPSSDYPPLGDDLAAHFESTKPQDPSRPIPESQLPARRPGAGRKATGLRINTPNPPPIGSRPDPRSDHVTAFLDGSLRGLPKDIWAYLKGVGLCANKNCRQQLDDPYYASCAKCRAADNIKAKRYQAKKKAARAAAAVTVASRLQTPPPQPQQQQQQQQHEYVLGHSRVEKQSIQPFTLPPWLRDELARLESQQKEGEADDGGRDLQKTTQDSDSDRYQRIREELYHIVLGRAETSIAQIRAQPQNAVSQEAMIQAVNLRTLDDLTAVRLATDGAVRRLPAV